MLMNASTASDESFEYVVTHDRELIIRAALVLWARIPKRGPDLPE
jgi:hypothetical protein